MVVAINLSGSLIDILNLLFFPFLHFLLIFVNDFEIGVGFVGIKVAVEVGIGVGIGVETIVEVPTISISEIILIVNGPFTLDFTSVD